MAATIIYNETPHHASGARVEGDALWLSNAELAAATGWEIKPEGICRDELCIPVTGERQGMLRGAGDAAALDLAAFARYLGQPIAHAEGADAWYFGAPPSELRNRLLSLEAPDFALPDLAGTTHRLSDYRGRKVFLLAWASW